MNLVLLGPPGAGKGSLANLIRETYSIAHISTGDMLREEVGKNSDLGLEAKRFIESGKLVPDDIVIKLIHQKLLSLPRQGEGYMLDGFPRNQKQAQQLDEILEGINQSIDTACYLEATLPIILQRLTGRRVCRKCGALFHIQNRPSKREGICDQCGGVLSQRTDDKEETIKTRYEVYLKDTKPIIDYYQKQGKLRRCNADEESRELFKKIMPFFDEYKRTHNH